MEQEKIDILRLIRSANVGPIMFNNLLQLYGSASKALENLSSLAERGGSKKTIKPISKKEVEKEIDNCRKIGAEIITIFDEKYPALLREIYDPPIVITVLGNKDILNKNSLAIVGARNASMNAVRFTEMIADKISLVGYNIVSGFARGIDTAAHHASLKYGTIAVVAGGINHIYPKENSNLYKKIVDNGGAIIAENAFGNVPRAKSFPRRNRIISGMSFATLVVEASVNSGSLITARMALEQNREVMAVPGFPLDPRSHGPNKLLKEGAKLIENAEDVLLSLSRNTFDLKTLSEKQKKPKYDNPGFYPDNDEVDKIRQKIEGFLSSTPIHMNDLIKENGNNVNLVSTAILELELAGKVTRYPGNKISKLF